MQLHPLDTVIIGVYLVLVVVAGVLVSRRASRDLDSYFLGGKSIPWYLLGISNASGMFDITGTMWMVMLLFIYGLKSVWIPWLWPSFNQIFLMIYLAVWLRRSNVLTGAEWMRIRFGVGGGANLAHLSVVFFALVNVVGLLAYAFQGIGKFAVLYFPASWHYCANTYAIAIMSVTAVYVVAGGMYSVVLTDLMQYVILTAVSLCVGYIAFTRATPEAIAAVVPSGWNSLFFGWHLNLYWSQRIAEVTTKINEDGYSLFGIFFMMMVFKGVLASMAGPVPNYDMQRVLATRTPRDSALMSGIVSFVLLPPRYLLVAGVAVLALLSWNSVPHAVAASMDFEQVLPFVMTHYMPVGLVGLLLAGLLAAFMSTFDSTVNAGAAYLVNDLYKRYWNSNASPKTYVTMSYGASLLVVAVGMFFGARAQSINSVLQWLLGGLYGGYIAANVLKWYWWRLNGYGYFAGMLAGLLGALALPHLMPGVAALNAFPLLLFASGAVTVLTSLWTPPDEEAVLEDFYRTVRPWGFWGPIHAKVQSEDPSFEPNRAFARDALNVFVGVAWQTSLVLVPIYLILRAWTPMCISLIVAGATMVFLKLNWYDKLEEN